MYKIVAIKRKTGVYEGNAYDNYSVLSVNEDSTVKSVVCGGDFDIAKVKAAVFQKAIDEVNDSAADWITGDLSCLVGRSVDYQYDKYQNVVQMTIS